MKVMKQVVLKGKYNTVYGMTLLVETNQIINVGDKICAGDEKYHVEGFVTLSKSKPEDPISIIAKPLN